MPADRISDSTPSGYTWRRDPKSMLWLVALCAALALPAAAGDAQRLVESQRYQQAWAPASIEVVLADVAPGRVPKAQSSPGLAEKIQRLAPSLRKALADYAADFSLELHFVEASAPCQAGDRRARIGIAPIPEKTARKAQRNSMGEALVRIPIKASLEGCGPRSDTFTREFAFLDAGQDAPAASRSVVLDKAFQQALDSYARDVLDELLLVWHPAWNLPERGSTAFALFALEPVQPPPTTGVIRNAIKNRKIQFDGITVAADPQPEFRWMALQDLAGRAGDTALAAQISDVRYEFRLYAGRGLVPVAQAPGDLMSQKTDLAQASFKPTVALEPCRTHFWTVRARFHLDGFPRVTEWTALHNGLLGVAPPWAFRRGEWAWTAWHTALAYPAFKTPSTVTGQACP